MNIDTEINAKIQKEIIFLSGKIEIKNLSYFIDKIEEGVKNSPNNYSTNVVGKMTSWDYFNHDKSFLELLFPLLDKLDTYNFIGNYYLKASWGYIEEWGGRTKQHQHLPSIVSGVLYLSEHSQELIFPQINKKIKPEIGKFLLFSSDLSHKCDRTLSNKKKYGIAFNLDRITSF
jgi:hypothetical protein